METETKELWRKFGLWYQNARENVHKTQEEVARIAGVHAKTLSRIENGEPTKRATVIKLAEAVGADTLEALNRAGFSAPVVKKLPEFLYQIDFAMFTPAELQEIESFIKFKALSKHANIKTNSDGAIVVERREGEPYDINTIARFSPETANEWLETGKVLGKTDDEQRDGGKKAA